jgi:hypothetical protein
MKTTITELDFKYAFLNANRGDNFSYEGLGALFEYLERLEDDIGEEFELDVIAICCDFTEYESIQECADEYGIEGDEEEILDELRDNTQVIELDSGGIIIQCY